MSVLSLLLGPLVVPECRRAGARGWLILVRTLAAIAGGIVVVSLIWFWWFFLNIEPDYWPYTTLRTGLSVLEGMILVLVLVFSPAVLAGSLAGDKERGSLGLLMTTRVSSREIVTGRLAGKLSQVVMIALTFVPLIILLAALAGFRAGPFLTLFLLPAAVAFGAGGIAIAASALSRRGRDALLVVYFLDVLFVLAPLLSATMPTPAVAEAIRFFSPFQGVGPLIWEEQPRAALGTIVIWTAFGLAATALAAWRLRPTLLAQFGGATRRRRSGRAWIVPPVNERPMLWKELWIERVGTLGRFGRWIGFFIVAALALGSTALAALDAWFLFARPDPGWSDALTRAMTDWIGTAAPVVVFFIQWAIGLRGGVAISSERERGTWDALLTSPLQGGEIVVGKLWGSLYSLKWLFLAALWAWTLALLFGAMSPREYFTSLGGVFIIGAFMAAVGVRASLATSTATRAMSITIGVWLAALAGFYFVASVIVLVVMLLCLAAFGAGYSLGMPWTAPWFPMSFEDGLALANLALYAIATVLVVTEARLRFDRIAGRMAGGGVQTSVDRLLHGTPMAPVLIEAVSTKKEHVDFDDQTQRVEQVAQSP